MSQDLLPARQTVAMAVSLGVEPAVLPKSDGDAPLDVASALLAALATPLTIRWEVRLDGGGCVTLSAPIASGMPGAPLEWPPPQLMLRVDYVGGGQSEIRSMEFKVPSKLTSDKLGAVISGCLSADLSRRPSEPVTICPNHSTAASAPPPMAMLDADPERGIVQPKCVLQWHDSVCGHHALFNVRQLLNIIPGVRETDAAQPEKLLDEESFWQTALSDVKKLAEFGECTGRWPKSRVTCGVLDGVHMAQLISTDSFLRGRVSIVENPEMLRADSAAGRSLAAVAAGHQTAHAFLLGCSIHWMGLVAAKVAGWPQVWICDSFNRPLVQLLRLDNARDVADRHELKLRDHFRQFLRAHPEWEHQPEWNIDQALEDGIPEWWKGIRKSPAFWRWQPREVRRALAMEEVEYLQQYLMVFVAALVPTHAL
mmetsp:Transcript_84343/g.239070  ORF Transcript_84343/g.239070 Transcript_84343/m.239070 type:complete len:425 (+) Transcript_84343:92-1366(+)